MTETSPQFHNLNLALATAQKLIGDLPDHHIRDDVDEMKLKSYTFLKHAAFEEYLETVSVYVMHTSLRNFECTGLVPHALISAVSFYEINLSERLASPVFPSRSFEEFHYLFKKAIGIHIKRLSSVNGIKTKDQDKILCPLGIKVHEFDNLLSQMLNALGENRGSLAHSFGIRSKSPKVALLSNTNAILPLLQSLDNELCRRANSTWH